MKNSVRQFKGRIPRLASRLLPDGYAEVASNCRLKSGDLECWNSNTTVNTPSKVGTKNAIFPLDLYGRYTSDPGPFWLHWTESEGLARVARGFAKPPSDAATKERIYIAGLDRPRVTDIDTSLDGGGTDYPLRTYYLGVKAPTTAPTISSVAVDPTPTADVEYDGTDIGGWATSQIDPDDTDNTVGINSGEFEFKATNLAGLGKSVYMSRDDGFGTAYYSRLRAKFRLTASSVADADGVYSGWLNFCYGCTQDGTGDLVGIRMRSDNTGSVYLGNQPTWDRPRYPSAPFALSGTPTLGTNYYLQVELTKDVNTLLVSTTIKIGTTLGASDLANISITKPLILPPNPANNPSGALVVGFYLISPQEVSNFYYGFSLTTFADSNGPHISYVDDIELVLVGRDAGEGAESSRYVYTWVNAFGEESEPSPLSDIVFVDPELTINLSTIADASAGDITNYGIVGKRLYRLVAVSDTSTEFRLVADQTALPNATTTYADTTDTEDLSTTVLESEGWTEPPTDSVDICALANGIMLIASGNEVYPSVAYRPHAYPLDYARAADFPIVGMAAIENQAIVLTEECPYLIRGDDPSAMSMDKISSVYGCSSISSIIRWKEYGVCYASFDGFISVTGAGARNLTEEFFTRDEWSALNPESMVCAVYDEVLFVSYDNGVTSGTFTFDPQVGVVDLAFRFTAAYLDPIRDRLFLQVGSNIVEWNTGSALQATWRQGIRQLPYPAVFSAAQVKAPNPDSFTSVTMRLYRNGSGSAFATNARTSDTEFRLPGDASAVAREIQIELVTTGGVVNTAEIAEEMDELE